MVKDLVVRRLNDLLALGSLHITGLNLEVFVRHREHNGIMECSDTLGFTHIL